MNVRWVLMTMLVAGLAAGAAATMFWFPPTTDSGTSAVTVPAQALHDVSRAAALRLRAAGIPARFLQGGLEGWVAAGQPVERKDAPAKAG